MGSVQENEFSSPKSRLLVSAIEQRACLDPNDTYLRYAPLDWKTNGYKTISWKQYANAIDKVAYLLDEKLGKTTEPSVIGYFGPNDARYGILLPACIKAGKPLLVVDGRLTPEGLNNLLTQTMCKAWLYAEDDTRGPLVGSDSGLQTMALPCLDWMLEAEDQRRYPYDKTFEEAAWDNICIIHTSGTTGLPKPIFHNNGFFATFEHLSTLSQRHWPRGLDVDSWIGVPCLNVCPPQWIVGLAICTAVPVYYDSHCILPPPDVTGLSPKTFMKICNMNKVHLIVCPPYTITSLYNDTESKARLKSLRFVGIVGAALDPVIGDDLCQSTRLVSMMGSTETGPVLSLRPSNRMLWNSFDFVPETGARMVSLDADDVSPDLHELVFECPEKDSMYKFSTAWWNPAYKNIQQIKSKELYKPIKDSNGQVRWTFVAREDDLLKLNWLAKFHAQDIENHILQHPDVNAVLVGGEGRPCPFVIIEAKPSVLDMKSEQHLLDEIYQSVIADTNKATIDEIRIPKETVLIAKKERPFQLTLKQSIMRKAVEQEYSDEIESAYSILRP